MKKILSIIVIIFMSLVTVGCKEETKQIILYLPQGYYSSIDSNHENYSSIKSDIIDSFNKRLIEMDIQNQLVIKTYDNKMYLDNRDKFIDLLLEKDPDVDMVLFDQTYVDRLLPLDNYLKTSKGKDITSYYSQELLERAKINGSIYMIPKVIYPLTKQYVQIKDNISDFEFSNVSNLSEFLEKFLAEYQADGDIYILNLDLSLLISDKYQSLDASNLNCLYLRKSDNKIVNAFDEEYILEAMRLINKVHQAGFTGKGLSYPDNQKIYENSDLILELGEDFIFNPDKENRVYLGKEHYSSIAGLSILKDSNEIDGAFEILWAMNTDKSCSEILQPLSSSDNQMYFGSFNLLGNNYLIPSTEEQPKDKQEYYSKLEEQSDVDKSIINSLYFDLSQVKQDLSVYNEIVSLDNYWDPSQNKAIFRSEHAFDETAYEKYLQTVREKLKEAGIDKTVSIIQEQVDAYGT